MTDPSPPLPRLPKHLFQATQAEADALVAEAAKDDRFRPLPELPRGNNAVRMIVGMWYCHGSLALPRGWVRAVMLACRSAGAPHPDQRCLRWYRSKLRDAPVYFAGMRGVPSDLILLLEQDVDAG
ncbi:hypothetical protein [Litorisediminicola beolgyonensis]|uniref:Uncharacterized protein n=1 Tax=Litorisediminicola beolgyonensis TaxID=1173614 RepID=A0ABW3ZND3_9RHOB